MCVCACQQEFEAQCVIRLQRNETKNSASLKCDITLSLTLTHTHTLAQTRTVDYQKFPYKWLQIHNHITISRQLLKNLMKTEQILDLVNNLNLYMMYFYFTLKEQHV